MKVNFNITAFIVLTLTACSKKGSDVQPNSVKIGGAQYPTVVIGNETWTSVNYNGPGGVNYNNSQVNDPVYGKLYNYTEAKSITPPPGWHLPTQSDFTTLFNTLGATPDDQNYYVLPDSTGRKLMSTTTWANGSGNNKIGFNAVGSGFVVSGSFSNLGHITNILTSSKFQNGQNISFEIYEYGSTVIADLNSVIPNDTDRGSVRFVKDN